VLPAALAAEVAAAAPVPVLFPAEADPAEVVPDGALPAPAVPAETEPEVDGPAVEVPPVAPVVEVVANVVRSLSSEVSWPDKPCCRTSSCDSSRRTSCWAWMQVESPVDEAVQLTAGAALGDGVGATVGDWVDAEVGGA